MKKLKKIVFTGFAILLIPILGMAQFTESKQINKRYKATRETRVEITNKYGQIKINTWEKDSVVFDIKIRVEDKKLTKLEKLIDDVEIDFTGSQHFIIAHTKVGESRSSIEKEILNFKESVFQSDGKIEINYTVWMPKSNPLKIENKFGDIYIGDYLGDIDINLSNGNFKSHDFSGKTKLTLSFGDATINKMKSGTLNCNYSEIYIKEADKLQIESKSSEFEITEIKEINAESRRDKFRINLIDNITAKGSFTNYRITELNSMLNLKTEYGDLDIEKVATDFKSVYVESKSMDINLGFSEKSEFGFDITHVKSEINFPGKMTVKNEEVLDEKEKKVQITGNFGNNSKPTKLFINTSGGGINVSEY